MLSLLVEKRKQGRPKLNFSTEVKESMLRGYNEGTSLRDLAKEFGVAYATVRTRLLGWGVKLRPARWPPEAWRGSRDSPETETGNRGESNPGEDSAESNPGVNESPPARHLAEESTDHRRGQILELETEIAEGEVNLRKMQALKYEREQELAKLKGFSMMPGGAVSGRK